MNIHTHTHMHSNEYLSSAVYICIRIPKSKQRSMAATMSSIQFQFSLLAVASVQSASIAVQYTMIHDRIFKCINSTVTPSHICTKYITSNFRMAFNTIYWRYNQIFHQFMVSFDSLLFSLCLLQLLLVFLELVCHAARRVAHIGYR